MGLGVPPIQSWLHQAPCQVMIFPASSIAKGGSVIKSCPVRCMENARPLVFAFFIEWAHVAQEGSGTWNAIEMPGALGERQLCDWVMRLSP